MCLVISPFYDHKLQFTIENMATEWDAEGDRASERD